MAKNRTLSTKRGGAEIKGLNELIKNFSTLSDLVTLKVARAVAVIGSDLLANAQPRVPYDTGELRKSGLTQLNVGRRRFQLSKGNEDGTVTTNLGLVTIRNIGKAKSISAEVSYYRFNPKTEFDVAIFTHEVIGPQDERGGFPGTPHAIQPGTGPKYLEIAYNEKRDHYESLLQNMFSDQQLEHDIALISKTKQKRTGKYGIDVVELIHNRIDRIGYYGRE